MALDLTDLSIGEAARRIRDGRLSPVELVDAHLARVEQFNGGLNALATLTDDEARRDARLAADELARGLDRGPLHGIPISLKDNIDRAGVRTTAGCRLFAHHVAKQDSTVAARLRAAGAVLLGKANMHELALGVQTENPLFGQTRNPWDPSRIPGGSSGGSAAAVAAGMGMASIGTDSGGSVRIPAALCGVVGLKPTYGRVSNAGILPNYPSFDCAGPLARSAEDVALVLRVIAGYDADDFATIRTPVEDYVAALSVSVEGVRVGVPGPFFRTLAQPQVSAAFDSALGVLRASGMFVVDVDLPPLESPWSPATARPEVAERHADACATRSEEISSTILRKLRAGLESSLLEHLRARRQSERDAVVLRRLLETVDLVALPTVPTTAPPIGASSLEGGSEDDAVEAHLVRFVRLFSLLRVPSLSVPCGFGSDDGLPVGLQLVGRPFDEALLLRVAHAYQERTDWHLRRPRTVDWAPQPAANL
jgi:aspartyl-tRNA(Asn)/glutamyl-tRNA(Gln) amidotransferase subunit A